jgi:hypothetical protein
MKLGLSLGAKVGIREATASLLCQWYLAMCEHVHQRMLESMIGSTCYLTCWFTPNRATIESLKIDKALTTMNIVFSVIWYLMSFW